MRERADEKKTMRDEYEKKVKDLLAKKMQAAFSMKPGAKAGGNPFAAMMKPKAAAESTGGSGINPWAVMAGTAGSLAKPKE